MTSDSHSAPTPMPVTASGDSERPERVAFDVAGGTPGMPAGEQTATNEEDAQHVSETFEVPPGGLQMPGTD